MVSSFWELAGVVSFGSGGRLVRIFLFFRLLSVYLGVRCVFVFLVFGSGAFV